MQDILVDVVERIYDGSMVKFELESIMTAWCKSDSGCKRSTWYGKICSCKVGK